MPDSLAVILPAYNAGRHVAEAVRSVLEQTHGDFELLIVDDGSVDGTADIIRQICGRDRRLRLVVQENQGMGAALNAMMVRTDARWIARMDADDVMEPQRLERQLAWARAHPEWDVIGSFVTLIDDEGRTVGRSRSDLVAPETARQRIAAGKVVGLHHPSVLFRRRAVLDAGGYRPEFWPADDLDLWTRMVERGYGVAVMPEFLLRYRIHAGSISVAGARRGRLKHSWVKQCAEARRNRLPEPAFSEYLNMRAAMPCWERLMLTRRDWARILYKAAAHDFARRRYLRLAGELLVAGVLEPDYVFRQVVGKYVRS